MARHFYKPVLVSAVPEGDGFVLKAINDNAEEERVNLEVFAVRLDGSKRSLGEVSDVVAPAAATEIFRTSDVGEDELLVFGWRLADGLTSLGHFAPKPYKSYRLEDPKISMSVTEQDGTSIVRLASEKPALFVALEASVPGRFSDNGFLLLPDEPIEIAFTPKDTSAKASFVLRDLYTATTA